MGQGDATIVLPPEGDPLLFDCRDGWVVRQQLEAWQCRRLHGIVASHLDLDHIAGFVDLFAEFRGDIGTVFWPVDRPISDADPGAKTAKLLADVVRRGDEEHRWNLQWGVGRQDTPIYEGRDWAIHVRAPLGNLAAQTARSGVWEDANCYSVVLQVTMAGTTVTVGGDAPLVTWAGVLGRQPLRSHVFRIPHHGGALDDGGWSRVT